MTTNLTRPKRPEPTGQQVRLSPLAMLKLSYFCHAADTEIGGFGISRADDLLHVDDFELLRQYSTICTTDLDDEAVADHIEQHATNGIQPVRCGRVWIHTHPGSSATPSVTDEETFDRSFGGCDWSLMLILARGGAFSARLQYGIGPRSQIELPVRVDWSAWPAWSKQNADALPHLIPLWEMQLRDLVHTPPPTIRRGLLFDHDALDEEDWRMWIDAQLELEVIHDDQP